MKQLEETLYVGLVKEEEELAAFATLVEEKVAEGLDRNILVDLRMEKEVQPAYLLRFVNISEKHRERGKSFVIVTDQVGIDEVPEELIVTPTLQEAKDLIEMEEIERDLGF